MALSTSTSTSLDAGLNTSFTAPDTQGFCSSFYGVFSSSVDCVQAISRLEVGSDVITYVIGGGGGEHTLPLSTHSGNCMIQVEVAGPRHGNRFTLRPDTIRSMAETILESCTYGTGHSGGFLTSDLTTLKSYVVAPSTDLDNAYPFLTVILSGVVPDWLSPGNYDPIIAEVLATAAFNAATKTVPTSRFAQDLRRRATRFLMQGEAMQPRGHRVPWWESPPGVALPNSTDSTLGTADVAATSRRRKRRGV
ncbi:hypothetical protein MMC28_004751 [Mycoblastus sanguinarius]|nr:hypothetical protein [Mycoblastus sanguinarius]